MRKILTPVLMGLALIAGTYPQVASARVLVSNLESGIQQAAVIINTEQWTSQSFVNDSERSVLTNIVVALSKRRGTPDVFAELRQRDVTGTVITRLTVPMLTGSGDMLVRYNLTPNTRTILDPNQTYWLTLGMNGPDPIGQFGWGYQFPDEIAGTMAIGTGLFDNFADSSNAGGDWDIGSSGDWNFMEVNVISTGIPEPASWALMIAGLGFVGGTMRRRRVRVLYT